MNDNSNHLAAKGRSVLENALDYASRGWCIVRAAANKKKPLGKWTQFQTERPTEEMLQKWFGNGKQRNLGVILGQVSGGLACRDFDTIESYKRWAAAHGDLAARLPTVKTRRGYHVYFITKELRYIELSDGEFRADSKHFNMLPPSLHPEGHVYRWVITMPDGPLPFIADVNAAGFLDTKATETHATESTQITEITDDNRGLLRSTEAMCVEGVCSDTPEQPNGSVVSVHSVAGPSVEQVIEESLPKQIRQRHCQVFDLARALKAIPWLADAEGKSLEQYVRRWHCLGVKRGVIATVPFEETWIDFSLAWPKIKFPKGAEPMATIFSRAQNAIPPAAQKYEQSGLRVLVAICRELQRAAGTNPFFLGCRTAGRLLGVDHTTAWRWLWLLKQDGILHEVEKGDHAKRRASRYRYLRE
ncbi:MAG: bifunctional DNA primase/polymerase [Candidatus Anammoximicrobium sp.]|nr:bifunctional DNA primase/polymerase [Candidatus Anammoximicrobium sp.]